MKLIYLLYPEAFSFFDAMGDSIFSFDKTYKKERGRVYPEQSRREPDLCSRSKKNVVVLLTKKGNDGDSVSGLKTM